MQGRGKTPRALRRVGAAPRLPIPGALSALRGRRVADLPRAGAETLRIPDRAGDGQLQFLKKALRVGGEAAVFQRDPAEADRGLVPERDGDDAAARELLVQKAAAGGEGVCMR